MTFFEPVHYHHNNTPDNNNAPGHKNSHSSSEPTPIDPGKRPRLFYVLLLLTLTGLTPVAWALPVGGQIVAGQAEIVYGERTVNIIQHSAHLRIEWERFEIDADESVTLSQPEPGATAWLSVVANGAGDSGPGTIDGTLSANGQVVIAAPDGLALGSASVVTAQSLLLTSLDSHPGCFVNVQRLELNRPGNPTAVISNAGTITVATHGLAALIAPGVENSGRIDAPQGMALLASGPVHAIHGDTDTAMQIAATVPTTAQPRRPDSSTLTARVSNSGHISTLAGTVILAVDSAESNSSKLAGHAINMAGTIQARSIQNGNGQIALITGENAGEVQVDGTLDAAAVEAGTQGGTVHVLGAQIALNAAADINVSGPAGGGTALIGGARQGGANAADAAIQYARTDTVTTLIVNSSADTGGYVPTSNTTSIDAGATVTADSTDSGAGGTIIVWADETTTFAGTISARGGANGGDGGFVETSGANHLGVVDTASVDALAPNGAVGDWLLDPATVIIRSGGTATLAEIADASDTTSNLVVDPVTINNATANVSIIATDTVTFEEAVSITAAGVGLTVTAGTDINIAAPITTAGPQTYNNAITLTGNTVLTSTGAGDITFGATIDGAQALTVNTAGVTRFEAGVGQTTPLASLETDAPGTLELAHAGTTSGSPSLRTTGSAIFRDPATLFANFIMENPNTGDGVDAGSVTFDSTVDGAHQIVINLFGTATFNGAIGATTPLQAIQVRGVDGIFLNGGAVTNSRLQTWFGDVVLGADTMLTSTGDTNISFTGAFSSGSAAAGGLDGAFALTVNTGGATNFFTPVGATTPLTSITTDAAGTTVFTGAAITLSGNTAIFNDAVILTADTTITDAGAVTFNNTVDGGFGLTVDAGGNVTFGAVVGGTTPLGSLTVGTDGAIIFGDPITTADGAVTFEADTMAIAAAIDAGTGIVTLRPRTAGREIDLGTDTATSLALTDAEIDLITAGILRIGSADAGSITFNASISPALTGTLSLTTGDAILDTNGAGADVEVASLAIRAVNGIADNETLDTSVGTLAALNTTDNSIAVLETSGGGDLTIGTVDGLAGVVNQGSGPHPGQWSIIIETNNGDLTIAAGSPITAEHGGIFLVAQQGNGGSGDSLFTNRAAITMEAGNGQIEIIANNMDLGNVAGGSSITALNDARIVLKDDPSSSSTIAINLGGGDGVNTLGLTDDELDTVTTAGVLQIGHSGSGDITVLTSIDPAGVSTVDLETGGKVLDGDAFFFNPVEVTNLAIRAGAGIGTALDDLDVEVSNLAFSNAAGVVNIQDFTDLTIAAVDGLATSSNAGTTTAIEILDNGELTFAVDTSSTGDATFTVPILTVGNSVTVNTSPAGTLAFNATTVNLDGNLSAVADGITGTATMVNVISSTGGAELQDAIDVAAAGATVNVGDGTFAGNVTVNKALTLLGDGFSTTTTVTVADGSAGMTITTSDVTIDGFQFTGDGSPTDATGVLVDGSGSALTGLLLGDADTDNLGNRFTGLTTGVIVNDGSTGNGIVINIGLGNVIDNSVNGLVFDGAAIDIVGDTLNDTAFDTLSGNYIELANGAEFLPGNPTIIDATQAVFDGATGAAQVAADTEAALEAKFIDFDDDPSLGQIGLAGTVQVHLFIDIDGDSTQNGSDQDLPDVTVLVTDTYGNEQTMVTDPSGDATAPVAPGTVNLMVDESTLPAGNTLTTGNNSQNLTVAFGQTTSAAPIGYQPSAGGDDDGDGISNSDELNAPNEGDGNFDSILDFLQGHVASLPNPLTTDYITLAVDETCAPIEHISVQQESAFGVDYSFDYPQGLLGFELPCASAAVTVFYHDLDAFPGDMYRKFGPTTPADPTTQAFYTLPDVVFGTSNDVLTTTFTLTDGLLGDDETASGPDRITDPGGLAFSLTATIPTLGTWGLGLLVGVLGLALLRFGQRRANT